MKKCTNSELKAIFEVEQTSLEAARKNYPWEHQAAYIDWLVNSYEYASKSTRLLALTGGRMPLDKTSFSNRFIAHAAEEKGHERLLENDLKKLGVSISSAQPSAMSQAFHRSLYFWVYESNPLGMFGWVLALEGFAVRNVPEMYRICQSAHGKERCSFLKVHAEEDEGHLAKAFDSIKSFTDEENALVAGAMIFYSRLYAQSLLSVSKFLDLAKAG